MKVAVIGNGNVGMAAFGELLRMLEIRELALVGRNVERIRAEVDDYADAQVLHTAPGVKLSGGGYEKTEGADILLYAAGAAQKPGQTRLDLAAENVRITRQIFSEVNRYNRDGIVICEQSGGSDHRRSVRLHGPDAREGNRYRNVAGYRAAEKVFVQSFGCVVRFGNSVCAGRARRQLLCYLECDSDLRTARRQFSFFRFGE